MSLSSQTNIWSEQERKGKGGKETFSNITHLRKATQVITEKKDKDKERKNFWKRRVKRKTRNEGVNS